MFFSLDVSQVYSIRVPAWFGAAPEIAVSLFFRTKPCFNELIARLCGACAEDLCFLRLALRQLPNSLSSVMQQSLYFLPTYASFITNLYLLPV